MFFRLERERERERDREGVSGLERKKRLVVEEKLKESFGKEEKSYFRERDREMWFFC